MVCVKFRQVAGCEPTSDCCDGLAELILKLLSQCWRWGGAEQIADDMTESDGQDTGSLGCYDGDWQYGCIRRHAGDANGGRVLFDKILQKF
jgi:hypothetical protein